MTERGGKRHARTEAVKARLAEDERYRFLSELAAPRADWMDHPERLPKRPPTKRYSR